MKVILLQRTPDAAALLVFTKNTRLSMNPIDLHNLRCKRDHELKEDLAYMATTIRSSWEFVDVIFLVQGVTRAVAQQMTRTRTGTYAMQSQRVTDASKMEVVNPFPAGSANWSTFDDAMLHAHRAYAALIQYGAKAEDARGLLPMNTTCNLVCKYNLRSFVELVTARTSLRVQPEYGEIISQMKDEVIRVWPWAEDFFKPRNEAALDLLSEVADEVGVQVGKGPGWKLAKAMDLLRQDG